MNEVQGPTPAGTSRPYRTLAEALRAHRIPVENHEFIGALTESVGISSFIDRGRYIEALRREEGAPLHIGKTYINGFTAEEAPTVGGRALPLLPSEGREPFYFVTYPAAQVATKASAKRAAGPRSAAAPKAAPRAARATKLNEREYGQCDVCFMVRNASGKCACDD
ncbi:hypothetical protein FM104_05680 [Microbacterium esteraromaticum]|uniref:Uncharacterized protein n=1 Tax=Microbacterium esteraromaticum TaxID=57043 RepID=A0A1R4J6K2_9MICO|nr:hypothetical protein [Microbacterium esteraromaticum]SJN27652.1 hypothetical protein FM104_05680 [Microbacterium esteraromaticum]